MCYRTATPDVTASADLAEQQPTLQRADPHGRTTIFALSLSIFSQYSAYAPGLYGIGVPRRRPVGNSGLSDSEQYPRLSRASIESAVARKKCSQPNTQTVYTNVARISGQLASARRMKSARFQSQR